MMEAGYVPPSTRRDAIAAALGVDAELLWPALGDEAEKVLR